MTDSMNENLESLIGQLKDVQERYGGFLQKPASNESVERLCGVVKERFGTELSPVYRSILLRTDGFNENGVYLYGSETALLQGRSDLHLGGLMEQNEIWHWMSDDISKYLFYADSDLYVFGQSLETGSFVCFAKDCIGDYLIFETDSDSDFFERIFRLAVDDGFCLE